MKQGRYFLGVTHENEVQDILMRWDDLHGDEPLTVEKYGYAYFYVDDPKSSPTGLRKDFLRIVEEIA